jgi:hypothetical protein
MLENMVFFLASAGAAEKNSWIGSDSRGCEFLIPSQSAETHPPLSAVQDPKPRHALFESHTQPNPVNVYS